MFEKRMLVFLVALLLAGPFSAPPADAAQYPRQPITLIVPFVAGAGTDTNARIISKYAPKFLGVPVVVLNRPGAAGAIGYTQLAQAKPDGYTIGYTNLPNMIQLVVDGNVKFKIEDFKPIIGQVKESKVITVIQKSPFKTIEELVEFAKQNPGKLLAASNGPGSHNESVLNAFSAKAGIKMIMIPYKGDGAMKVAMLGQEAQVMSIGTSGLDLVQFRPLMLFDTARDPHMPAVPTTFEKGFNLDMSSSRVLQAPMGAPPEALLYLESQLKKMFNDPEYLEDMNKGGGGAKMLTSDEVTKLILREKEFYSVNK
jgi:tripartite-type tricarboxylate transporter receptor subunit TctC